LRATTSRRKNEDDFVRCSANPSHGNKLIDKKDLTQWSIYKTAKRGKGEEKEEKEEKDEQKEARERNWTRHQQTDANASNIFPPCKSIKGNIVRR